MKKSYITPVAKIHELTTEEMLAVSGVHGDEKYNIEYGGVDEDGSLDPASKEQATSVWD